MMSQLHKLREWATAQRDYEQHAVSRDSIARCAKDIADARLQAFTWVLQQIDAAIGDYVMTPAKPAIEPPRSTSAEIVIMKYIKLPGGGSVGLTLRLPDAKALSELMFHGAPEWTLVSDLAKLIGEYERAQRIMDVGPPPSEGV